MHVVRTEQDTKTLADDLASKLKGGLSIGLVGGLGSGKTTFTRYLVGALGSLDPVSSPTYVLMHSYSGSKFGEIEHWDLYRLTEVPAELQEFEETPVIRIIEWVDKFPELESCCSIKISFNLVTEEERIIEIQNRLIEID